MDTSDIIDFGIFEDFSITFNTSNITNIFPLNHRECIASTSKEIIRFERKNIKARYPYTFSSCLIVPETEFIIGVTFKYGTLTVFRLSDISEPLLKDYQTNHHGIFHMFYSSKSNSIITIGSGIHVFTFHCEMPDKRISIVPPKITFTERSSFASNYDTTILTPPPFDSESELIYLPTSNGICPFTLDGKQLNPYTRIPATIKTVYTFNTQSKELLTYDSTDGMSLWGPSDNLICHFSTAGSSLIAILFVDQENVICLNSFNSLFYLNIKTSRTFHCLTLQQRPTRLFLIHLQNQPILFVCFSNSMKAMKLVIPWKVWNLNAKETVKIERCDKFCEAARVLVAMRGSFVKLYTPKNGEKVTVATPKIAVNSTSFLYDRGIFERYTFNKEKGEFMVKVEKTIQGGQREVLFVMLEDGRIIGFNTTVSPCDEVMNIKSKAVFMSICRYDDKWCYAVASSNSDLYILDYQNLKETHHFTVVNDRLLKFFYHYESESIVMVFQKNTLLFDLKKGQIGDILKIDGNMVTSLFANMIKYGYQSGHIAHVEIVNGRLVPPEKSSLQRPHSEAVSGFSFSLCFWISIGDDGKVIFWNFLNEKICQLSFPIALRAAAIMNGKRDVLVATESEIMIIEGSSLFDKSEVDREVSEIDNFDRLKDNLSSEVKFPLPSHDEDEEEALLRSNQKEENEYEYEEEEEIKEKASNLRDKTKIDSIPIQSNDDQNIQKKMIVEDSEEAKMKKLEAMQALNGIKKVVIPKMEQNENRKKNKKPKKESKISRNDANSLKNFIDNSIELEKEKNDAKPKKEKSSRKRKKEKIDQKNHNELKNDQNENESEVPLDDEIKNDESESEVPLNDEVENEKNDENENESEVPLNNNNDDDENLVLRMKVDKKEKSREFKNDIENKTEKHDKNKEDEKDKQKENKIEEPKQEKKIKNEKSIKPKNDKNDTINSKETKSSSQKVEKPNETKNDKKKLISIGTQPDKEENKKKEKTENKQNQTKPIEKVESKQNHSKSIEKVESKQNNPKKTETKKKEENVKKSSKKQKTDTNSEPKSDKKTKQKNNNNKEPKSSTKPSTAKSPHNRHQPHKKSDDSKITQKVQPTIKSDQKPLNFKKEEIESNPIKPSKPPDPLLGKRPRCPTPPPIRWKKPTFTRRPLKRASTPPLQNERPIMFTIPPPNIVLDKSAILEFYGRGKTELKPLVDLIKEEEERVRASLLYYRCHVKNFGSSSKLYCAFSSSFTIKPPTDRPNYRNRFFYRKSGDFEKGQFLTSLPPTRPSFFGSFFFFSDENDKNNDDDDRKDGDVNFSDKNANDNRKSEVNKNNENLPKFQKMKYAPPLNLIDQKKRHPQIHVPQPSSSRRSQFHKNTQIVKWPDNVSKSDEIECEEKKSPRKIESKKQRDLAFKPLEIDLTDSSYDDQRKRWSLLFPNFEGCTKVAERSVERSGNHGDGVDLLANAVMMKVPSLELPVSDAYKRSKSVRMRSPQQVRRTVPGMFFHQYEKKK